MAVRLHSVITNPWVNGNHKLVKTWRNSAPRHKETRLSHSSHATRLLASLRRVTIKTFFFLLITLTLRKTHACILSQTLSGSQIKRRVMECGIVFFFVVVYRLWKPKIIERLLNDSTWND